MTFDVKLCMKKVFNFFVSHFGALILVIIYLIGGGQLFVFLELDNEKSSCVTSKTKYIAKLNETVDRAITISEGGFNRTVLSTYMRWMLSNFSKDVYTLDISPEMDCLTIGQPGNLPSWNLPNSIYFCATIVSTIGYGHISPSTQWGQITCIIYAFIGIPLMLVYLGNLGTVLADAFRLVYLNFCCCRCFIKRRPLHQNQENNDSQNEKDRQLEFSQVGIDDKEKIAGLPPAKNIIEVLDEEDDSDEDSTINIPIIVVTGFLILYMFIGAFLFQIWESWTIVEGIYFAFITVSTIGFGDFYPAKDTIGSDAATVELIIGSIYSLVGLAVLSMCLTLIQEEIFEKFSWIGRKCGLIKKEEDEGQLDFEDKDTVVVLPNGNSSRTNLVEYDETKPIRVNSGRQMVFENETYEDEPEYNGMNGKKYS